MIARVALVAALVTGFATVGAPAGASTLAVRGRMYRATNLSRSNHSVRQVDIHYAMSKLARRHSLAMARKGYIFHTADPSRYYLNGVRWSTWGENVGVTPGTVAQLEQAFMDSAPHRANILNRGFRRVAVGTYRDDAGYLWVTVFFYG
jgi:uncharacterized protein YkwD